MSYTTLATSRTPALVIYLLDISASMDTRLGNKRRLSVALDALSAALKTMIFRATKGNTIQPRYRVAVYAYSEDIYDLLGGVKSIAEIAKSGLPAIYTQRGTDTARAFQAAADLLARELRQVQDHPAPLVCHLTDDRYTGADPEPIAKRIMQMSNKDGPVLVENIYISDKIAAEANIEATQWPGIQASTHLKDAYAAKLRDMSSTLPESYRLMMLEMGYPIAPHSLMLLPGTNPELVQLGFQMSSMTGVGKRA
jgi:hypothetical protein